MRLCFFRSKATEASWSYVGKINRTVDWIYRSDHCWGIASTRRKIVKMVNVGKETENVTGKMVVDEGTQTGINILSSIFHGFVGHMSESVVVTETSHILNGFQCVVVYMTAVEERWNVVGLKFSPACCR